MITAFLPKGKSLTEPGLQTGWQFHNAHFTTMSLAFEADLRLLLAQMIELEKPDMRIFKSIFATIFALFFLAVSAIAGPVNVDSSGLALEGHDAVAHFTEGKPVRGNPSFMVKHDGATYQFASAEHQALFEANPVKYAPQYGGFCAFGMSSGYQAPVEIDKFTVVDGKLFLNYNGSVQSKWRKDIPDFITKANAEWKNQ